MTDNHPITPTPELVREWHQSAAGIHFHPYGYSEYIAAKAAQWGADREFEMCIEVLGGQLEWDVLSQCTGWKEFRDQSEDILRAARRPKPPSLKELALERLELAKKYVDVEPIRRAIEQLPD